MSPGIKTWSLVHLQWEPRVCVSPSTRWRPCRPARCASAGKSLLSSTRCSVAVTETVCHPKIVTPLIKCTSRITVSHLSSSLTTLNTAYYYILEESSIFLVTDLLADRQSFRLRFDVLCDHTKPLHIFVLNKLLTIVNKTLSVIKGFLISIVFVLFVTCLVCLHGDQKLRCFLKWLCNTP